MRISPGPPWGRKRRAGPVFWLLLLCAVLLPLRAQGAPQTLLPGISVGNAASAASPGTGADAELAASLDRVIVTLENDQERRALLAELKRLREALPEGAGVQKVKRGGNLFESISHGFETLATRLRAGAPPLHFWRQRISAAADETAVAYQNGEAPSAPDSGSAFALVLSVWALLALALAWGAKRIRRHLGIRPPAVPAPSTRALAVHVLRRFGPWIIAFLVTVGMMHPLQASHGKVLALVLAYAVVSGMVFSSICALLFSLCADGHRRTAVRLLLSPPPQRLLYAIGVCFALGDAATGERVALVFPPNVLALADSLVTVVTALLIGLFALLFRRPVMHLIANRPFPLRHQKGWGDIRQFLGKIWAPLMIVLAVAAGGIALFVPENTYVITRRVVASVALLMLGASAALLLRRRQENAAAAQMRHWQRTAYMQRLRRFFFLVLTFVVWLVFLELIARTWDYSLADFMHETLGKMLAGVCVTAMVAWLVWTVVDTAILEGLSPHSRRSAGAGYKAPGARALTLLPLCRGAAGASIAGVAVIVALANLGIDITPFIAGAGVVGLAVGFGAQTLVQDIITGLFIIIEDTISIGDYIETADHAGTVEGLSIRTVRLRDLYGTLHTIPFSQIKTVKNLSRQFACAVFDIGVAYDCDIDAVLRAMRAVGSEMMEDYRLRRDLLEPLDVQGIVRFAESAIIVRAIFKTRPLRQWAVSREFNLRLKRKFDAEGIELPFPQLALHFPPEKEAASGTLASAGRGQGG